jgi:hypothetical protein
MTNLEVNYRGFILRPIADLKDGQYVSMLIVENPEGVERGSGMLGTFENADAACEYAVECGMAQIDGPRARHR